MPPPAAALEASVLAHRALERRLLFPLPEEFNTATQDEREVGHPEPWELSRAANSSTILQYAAVSFFTLQSAGLRLKLDLALKYLDIADFPAREAAKFAKASESFATEVAFYDSMCGPLVDALAAVSGTAADSVAPLKIAAPLLIVNRSGSSPGDSPSSRSADSSPSADVPCIVMEDVRTLGFAHADWLSLERAQAVARALARLQRAVASSRDETDGANDLSKSLVRLVSGDSRSEGDVSAQALRDAGLIGDRVGCYFVPQKPADTAIWANFVERFPASVVGRSGDLAVRLAALHDRILADFESGPQTLVHGDVKSANLFFNAENTAVAFVDWQWVGRGNISSDLGLLIRCSLGDPDDAGAVIAAFCDEMDGLTTRDEFVRAYRASWLAYAIWWVGSRVQGLSPESMEAGRDNANLAGIHRTERHLTWFLEQTCAFLDELERESATQADGL
jgi:Phosphotransferase enzyme family